MSFDGETRVGFGIGYARTAINGNTVSANTDSNTYEATAYIAHEQGPWFVDGDLSFGWNDYSESRNVLVPGIINGPAQGSYSGQDYTAFATTGYHFAAGAFTITPLASLQYTHMNLDSYAETGAAPLNLSVNSQNYDFLESALGVKASQAIGTANGTFVPDVHFKWFHELLNPRMQDTWAALGLTGSNSFDNSGTKDCARYAQCRRRCDLPVVLVHRENVVDRGRIRLLLEKRRLHRKSGDAQVHHAILECWKSVTLRRRTLGTVAGRLARVTVTWRVMAGGIGEGFEAALCVGINLGRGRDAAAAKRPHRVAGEAADHLHGRHTPCARLAPLAAGCCELNLLPATWLPHHPHPRCSAASSPPASRDG